MLTIKKIFNNDTKDFEEKIAKKLKMLLNSKDNFIKKKFTEDEKKKMRMKLFAMKELFDSEVSYVQDMELWDKSFRKAILNMSCIPTKQKYFLNEIIFGNLSELIEIHNMFINGYRLKHYEIMVRHNREKSIKTDKSLKNKREFIIPTNEFVNCYDLEYASLDLTIFIKAVGAYIRYIENLPSAVYEFESLMHKNEKFKKAVNDWFKKNNVIELGYRHFFYRPTSRVVRYGILNDAIVKHETNPINLQCYKIVNESLGPAIQVLDLKFKERSSFFNIYKLMNTFVFSEKNFSMFNLKLMDQRTKIEFNQQLITKSSVIKPASFKDIFVINNIMLICRTRETQFDNITIDEKPIFLSKYEMTKEKISFFDMSDNLERYFPIYFVQKETLDIKAIYFTDTYSRESAYELFKQMLKNAVPKCKEYNVLCRKNNRYECDFKEILCVFQVYGESEELEQKADEPIVFESSNLSKGEMENIEIGNKKAEEVVSVNTSVVEWNVGMDIKNDYLVNETKAVKERESYFNKNSSAFQSFKNTLFEKFYLEKHRGKKEDGNGLPLEEEIVEESDEKTIAKANCCGFVKPSDFFTIDIRIECEKKIKNESMTIFSTKNGIFKTMNGSMIKLWNKPAKKFLYDNENQMLIYQIENCVYISAFTSNSTSIKPQKINLKITDFFIGQTNERTYLVLTIKGDYNFCLMYVLSVIRSELEIRVCFEKKLYVGQNVESIEFFPEKLVVACNVFEVVDLKTLKTQQLIECMIHIHVHFWKQ
ncbi:rgf1 [Ecytonucleospora hepatopenaei]|uniref:Rgf1 n=1 Tax=Ecytonucleospora hepatopenaei TaxID=646526 RepID=A0A1W0E6X4_9MICR|nr:rgf1 [Ecytonucleospora hepatopenaei]